MLHEKQFTKALFLQIVLLSIWHHLGNSLLTLFHVSNSMFTGLGFLMVVISFNILWYYVTIMGWIQYYFISSFSAQLPWATCGNWWNTEFCKGNKHDLTRQ